MRLRLLLYAAACLALCAGVYPLAFDSARGAAFDRRVFSAAAAQWELPRVRAASRAVVDTVDVASLALLGGGIVAIALVRRRADVALAAAAAIAGANVRTQILKPGLHRLDPFGTEAGRALAAHIQVQTRLVFAIVVLAALALAVAVGLAALLQGRLGRRVP